MIPETLQSQLDNFTLEVFGTPVKTDVSPGVVDWEWPCGLETGLASNTRGYYEGITCYYLRLFRDEIERLQGPAGTNGATGARGYNGYTITTTAFSQPTGTTPFVLHIVPNPAVKAGEILCVAKSGWYQVLWVTDSGLPTVSLLQTMHNAPLIIPAGRVVMPVGPKGADQVGPDGNLGARGDKGQIGDKGPTGPAGADGEYLVAGPTEQNGGFVGDSGKDYFYVASSSPEARVVTFGVLPVTPVPDPPETPDVVRFTLTVPGKYLFKIASMFDATSDNARLYTGLVDTTTPANNTSPDPAGTNKFLPGSYWTNVLATDSGGDAIPFSTSCIITTSANYSIIEFQAFGKSCRILPGSTIVTWVRLT